MADSPLPLPGRSTGPAAPRIPGGAAVRRLLAGGAALTALSALAGITAAGWGLPRALGARPAVLRGVSAASPHASGGRYRNTEPPTPLPPGAVRAALRQARGRGTRGRPARPVPLARPELGGAAAELAVTWFGHASVLLEVDGHRVLADPVWGERVSPSRLVGPRRLHPVPLALDALPPLDAIVVSHDHYDHLDLPTVRGLAADPRHGRAPFVVPLGLGAHLRSWGVPAERVVELDWGAEAVVGGLRLVCAEARHFSGRGPRRDTTLWSSWAVCGTRHRVYVGGDTGYTAAFARTGAELGPFDLTVLPIGAYADLWPDIHLTPEQTAAAHRDLRGGVLLPVHWATFNLGFHAWAEPVERLRAAAGTAPGDPGDSAAIPLALPVPGRRIVLGRDHPIGEDGSPWPDGDWWSAAR